MLLKRISQKSIAEEYIIFDNVATLFRLRMNEFWFLKYKDITCNKLIKQSLNTKNFEEALRISLLSLRSLSSFDSVKSFEKSFLLSELIDNYLVFQNERVLNSEITKPRYNVLEIQLRKHLVNFIGNGNKFHGLLMVVNNIDADIFKNYFSFRINSEKKLSSNTLKNELNCFKNFFSWCNKYYFNNSKNFIFPKEFKETNSKRKGITPLEFFRIQAALKRWPDKALSDKDSYYKKVIRDFLFIQSSFLLSFSELKKLKWEDVSLIVKDQELTAKITIKNGKNIRVVSSRDGHYLFHIKTYSKMLDKENYVFSKFLEDDLINNNVYFYYLNKLLEDQKIEKTNRNIGFDDFKTMGIILKIKNGFSLFEIADITGENYIDLYKKFNDLDLKDVINKSFN